VKVAEPILWARAGLPGHDACTFAPAGSGWRIEGMAVWAENGVIARIAYAVELAADWSTRAARVQGMAGAHRVDIALRREETTGWWLNGARLDGLDDCLDIDLGFTPATNTNAIRRLDLLPGRVVQTTAAWLDTEDWQVKPLRQSYERLDDTRLRYRSPMHGYEAVLSVSAEGLVTDYPGLWQAVNPSH
jgi:uncharacterized protein